VASKLNPVAANDPATLHADWLELTAFEVADRSRSLQDLIQVIRRSGTAEEAAEEDPRLAAYDRGAEVSEAVADAAFAELEARSVACGGTYPFIIDGVGLAAPVGTEKSIYLFMLLLSTFGAKAGPKELDALGLFDRVAASAAANYVQGEAYLFGFPRRIAPRGFVKAVDDLTKRLGEGQGNRNRPTTRNQKDAKLDIVAWRAFEDRRPGKVIVFGQCATGADWKSKLTELQPRAFYSLWFMENTVIDPVRVFFMPFRVPEEQWLEISYPGGIIFDRCRIAHHARDVEDDVRLNIEAWNADVLANRVGP
jgi:hypothetical protein